MSSPRSDSELPAHELLAEGVRRWIWEQRWTALRDVQERAIRVLLESDRDLLIAAGTAAGKTEAAFLPILSCLATEPRAGVGALYVGPLKALINDQFRRLEELCEALDVPVHRWHGDVGQAAKTRLLEEPRGVLLITPESLEALFVNRGTACARVFEGLTHVVVDELHAFLGSERGKQLQSLLHRLEDVVGRRLVRTGLSATLGDMELAARFLRPDEPERVELLVSEASGGELRLAVRGHECSDEEDDDAPIAQHLFETLRGANHLVFANRRADVEAFADRLRALSEEARVPNEFHPHHGSLSRELREALEGALKRGGRPVTALCTTTMEMGIDLGSVASVAQLGAPTSVASLRQRLGRSGRRGDPAVLRVYVREPRLDADTALEWRLRPELVQTIAALELLLERWCEPPDEGGLHLSTLVQQTLSVIAERGGAQAARLGDLLLHGGPFGALDDAGYVQLLRELGAADLITQMHEGTLVLGLAGERLVGSYEFYAAFESSEEVRLQHGSTHLGSMPVTQPLVPESFLVFAGRRWRIVEVRSEERLCLVEPAGGGRPPVFAGGGAEVHGVVRARMRSVWSTDDVPAYLDEGARDLLRQGREEFARAGLTHGAVLPDGSGVLLFPWCGDRAAHTLALWLATRGLRVEAGGLFLRVARSEPGEVLDHVAELVDAGAPDAFELARTLPSARTGKYAVFLSDELAARDYASLRLDVDGALAAARGLL